MMIEDGADQLFSWWGVLQMRVDVAVSNTDSRGPFWLVNNIIPVVHVPEAADRSEHPYHKSLKRQSLSHEMNLSSNLPKSQVQIFKVFARIRVDFPAVMTTSKLMYSYYVQIQLQRKTNEFLTSYCVFFFFLYSKRAATSFVCKIVKGRPPRTQCPCYSYAKSERN